MKCPTCGDLDSRVVDSRLVSEGHAIRRRRQCSSCGRRYTTYERIQEFAPLVVKKDGRREMYDRDKVLSGLKKACEKRPVSRADLDRVIEELERSLFELGEEEVESRRIGAEVMRRLRDIDKVAYVRFASVYRSFKDVGEFLDELRALIGDAPAGGGDPEEET